MGVIEKRIDEIIATRKTKLEIIHAAKQRVEEVQGCIEGFNEFKDKNCVLSGRVGEGANGEGEIFNAINSISTVKFCEAYKEYVQAVNRLENRFSRDELHISFVGRAGQGKSLVLQNISGLNGAIIPSAEGSDCTGAKSIITNKDVEQTFAEVTFFTKDEILNIVNKYMDEIFPDKSYYIRSISEISKIPKEKLRSQLDCSQVNSNAKFEHLVKYVDHIDGVEEYLGKTINVSEEEIEQYVAQYNSKNPEIKYYNYLGVKVVNINCKFPHQDTGKIVLVDTIGIGATSLGVEDTMLETVENDSDAIVFMFRPEALRPRISEDEINIVEKIKDRISPEYAKELLFWVVNRVRKGKGENQRTIADIISQIKRSNYPIAMVLDVDCNSPEEVEEKLLSEILNVMSQRIEKVDKILIKSVNDKANSLYLEFENIRKAIEDAFISVKNEDIKRKKANEIQNIINARLLNGIRDLYLGEYSEKRNLPCERLQIRSQEKLKNIIKSVPSRDVIKKMLNDGTINQHNALEICQNLIRIKIIDDFRELDIVLNQLVCEMKKQIIHILVDEDKGKLGRVFSFDNETPEEWIDGFIKKIECEKKYPLLAKGLIALKEFRVSVEGFLIFEVRDKLDPIDASLQKQQPQIKANLADKDAIIEEIQFWLGKQLEEIYDEVRLGLMQLYSIPNRAMFAAVKDFHDRVAFSKDDKEGAENAEREWRYLYEDWINMIWVNEYMEHMFTQTLAEEWDVLISALKNQKKEKFFIEI